MRRETRYVIILCSLFATLASGCRDRTTTAEQPYRLGTEHSAVSTTAVGPDGTVYWTWFDREGDLLNVYFSRLEPGDEAPTLPIRVNHRDGEANMHGQAPAQVALGADGEVSRDMAIAHSVDGGASFSEARRIHVDGWNFSGCPHTGPDVVVDDTGRLHAAWYTGASDGSGLYYAVSDGDQFNEPVTLLSDVPVSQVRMAVDPLGGVWLAWEDPRAGVVLLAHSTNGSVEAPSASFDGNQPALAVGSGVKSMTWTSKNGLFASVIRQ